MRDLHPNTFSCMEYLHRIRQSRGSFLIASCVFPLSLSIYFAENFTFAQRSPAQNYDLVLKLFTQYVITLRCIKWDFYVIILHEKSIVLVCLFGFIEQRGCVTAVTICGWVAAILKFERLWTQVAICVQTDRWTFSLPVLGGYFNIAVNQVLSPGALREKSGSPKDSHCSTKKRNYEKKNVNYRL